MTNSEISQKADNIIGFLQTKQLKNAFREITQLITFLNNWELMNELEKAETTYKYMLQYMTDGIDDPNREKVYNDLIRIAYGLADKTFFLLREKQDERYYYQACRNLLFDRLPNYQKLATNLEDVATRISLSDLLENIQATENDIALQHQLEDISIQLFKKVWLNSTLDEKDTDTLQALINNTFIPLQSQSLLMSALVLSLRENFDEEKIHLLLDASEHKEEEIRQRALTGLLLTLDLYDKRLYLYPAIDSKLQHLAENPAFVQDIHTIIHQFILSKETERISRKISEEVMPEMIKMSPKFQNKINIADLMDEENISEKNPEWQNILEESGLASKLQEITEWQMEGADVMHSSFSNLKTYPFFHQISNWFLPFTSQHSSLNELQDGGVSQIMEAFSNMGYVCNSDKYSLYFSLLQMPRQYRSMMSSQMLSEVSEMMKQQQESQLIPNEKKRENISNQYIHDLYRFYKVHPRKADFKDIFSTPLAFYKAQSIRKIISNTRILLSIGEYYFSKNQYDDAKEIFLQLTGQDNDDAILYQKIGYCCQMNGYIEEALQYYLKSELLTVNHTWTFKKIASCYRILKQAQEALDYYKKVEALEPNNLSIQLNIGHCYLELKQYSEALKAYFKVEYLSKNKTKAWRPIAWCSFLTGKYEQAIEYYEHILNDRPEMSDYLNYGHTLLATKNTKEAIKQYRAAILTAKSSEEKFMEAFHADIPDLLEAGILHTDIPIILDQILYSLER